MFQKMAIGRICLVQTKNHKAKQNKSNLITHNFAIISIESKAVKLFMKDYSKCLSLIGSFKKSCILVINQKCSNQPLVVTLGIAI